MGMGPVVVLRVGATLLVVVGAGVLTISGSGVAGGVGFFFFLVVFLVFSEGLYLGNKSDILFLR